MTEPTPPGAPPLAGTRVLEVGNYMAAPYCGMQLADLGAEVIKVENPKGGDLVRQIGPFLDGESSPFVRLNRNKRSVAVDLKAEEGKAIFLQLARTADVVIENLRPGTMAGLGLDYPRLRVVNPGLVYVGASGWGTDGPLSSHPGLDIMAQARSGLMSITGTPGGEPVKIGVPVCDLVCALYGALAAVAALHARRDTGEGQFIDVSLFESAVSLAVWEAGKYFATGEIPAPLGSAHQSSAPYQAFRSSDGWLTIGATSEKNWTALCKVLGLTDLPNDERYADVNARHRNLETLVPAIEAVTTTAPTDHWLRLIEEAGIPCAPIQDFGQVFNDAHLAARGFFWDAPHPTLGKVRQIGSPMRLSGTPARRESAGPLLGEDTEAVLREAGYDSAEIRRLVDLDVLGLPPGVPR